MSKRELAIDGLFVAGAALVALGLGLVYLPLAPMAAGAFLIAIAVVLSGARQSSGRGR